MSLSTQVGTGCARWTYEPEEAVIVPKPTGTKGAQEPAESPVEQAKTGTPEAETESQEEAKPVDTSSTVPAK